MMESLGEDNVILVLLVEYLSPAPRSRGQCKAKGKCVTLAVAPSGIRQALEYRHSSFLSVPLPWLSPCLGAGDISSSPALALMLPHPTEAWVLSVLSLDLQAVCPSPPTG